jgi:hypothetical protein
VWSVGRRGEGVGASVFGCPRALATVTDRPLGVVARRGVSGKVRRAARRSGGATREGGRASALLSPSLPCYGRARPSMHGPGAHAHTPPPPPCVFVTRAQPRQGVGGRCRRWGEERTARGEGTDARARGPPALFFSQSHACALLAPPPRLRPLPRLPRPPGWCAHLAQRPAKGWSGCGAGRKSPAGTLARRGVGVSRECFFWF